MVAFIRNAPGLAFDWNYIIVEEFQLSFHFGANYLMLSSTLYAVYKNYPNIAKTVTKILRRDSITPQWDRTHLLHLKPEQSDLQLILYAAYVVTSYPKDFAEAQLGYIHSRRHGSIMLINILIFFLFT